VPYPSNNNPRRLAGIFPLSPNVVRPAGGRVGPGAPAIDLARTIWKKPALYSILAAVRISEKASNIGMTWASLIQSLRTGGSRDCNSGSLWATA